MADKLNRKIALNYPGGSIKASVGLLTAVFGAGKIGAAMAGSNLAIERKAHTRIRVIGQPGTSIAETEYTVKKYPKSQTSGPSGGEPIKLLYANEWWTARLSGNHEAFNDFLGGLVTDEEAGSGAIYWKSEKGSSYGPFRRP